MTIALLSHLMGAILLPAYLYLIIRDFRLNGFAGNPSRISGPGLLIIAVVILAIFDYRDSIITAELRTPFLDRFLPLTGEYGILSYHHIGDIINEVLLIIPGLLVLLPSVLSAKKTSLQKPWLFLLLILSPALFIATVDPQLGFARDWDLFAAPVAIIGTALIMQFKYSGRFSSVSHGARMSAVLFGILFAGLWVFTNSSESRQLERAENILMQTEKNQGYGLELLAHHYSEKREDNKSAIRILNRITGDARNARVLYKISRLEFKSRHYKKALDAALEGFALDSTDARLMVLAGASNLAINRPAEALRYLKPAGEIETTEAVIFRYLGEAYHRLDSLTRSSYAYERAMILDPTNPRAYFNAASVYLERGIYDSAFVKIKHCLGINPRFPGAQELYQAILVKLNRAG